MVALRAHSMHHRAGTGARSQLMAVSSVEVGFVRLDHDMRWVNTAGKSFSAYVTSVVAGWDLYLSEKEVHCPWSGSSLLRLAKMRPA